MVDSNKVLTTLRNCIDADCCDKCPYFHGKHADMTPSDLCIDRLQRDCFELIEYQKAEIKRLKEKLEVSKDLNAVAVIDIIQNFSEHLKKSLI